MHSTIKNGDFKLAFLTQEQHPYSFKPPSTFMKEIQFNQ